MRWSQFWGNVTSVLIWRLGLGALSSSKSANSLLYSTLLTNQFHVVLWWVVSPPAKKECIKRNARHNFPINIKLSRKMISETQPFRTRTPRIGNDVGNDVADLTKVAMNGINRPPPAMKEEKNVFGNVIRHSLNKRINPKKSKSSLDSKSTERRPTTSKTKRKMTVVFPKRKSFIPQLIVKPHSVFPRSYHRCPPRDSPPRTFTRLPLLPRFVHISEVLPQLSNSLPTVIIILLSILPLSFRLVYNCTSSIPFYFFSIVSVCLPRTPIILACHILPFWIGLWSL